MTRLAVVACDVVIPGSGEQCRRTFEARTEDVGLARVEASRHGWMLDPGGQADRCPSCSRLIGCAGCGHTRDQHDDARAHNGWASWCQQCPCPVFIYPAEVAA